MKSFIKNNLKVFVTMIITTIIVGSVSVYAASQYFAKDITFTPTNDNFKKENGEAITNVEDALNQLYKKTDDSLIEFRYFKLVITSTRSIPGENSLQFADWLFFDSDMKIFQYPAETTITTNLPSGVTEDISFLIDNNANTKYCSGAWGNKKEGYAIIKLDLGYNNTINLDNYKYYGFVTANDAYSRDPATWYLYGSLDDKEYKLLDFKYDINLTTNRKTLGGYWEFKSWNKYR